MSLVPYYDSGGVQVRYCEVIARRLDQGSLFTGVAE